jgi:hypothetical protein
MKTFIQLLALLWLPVSVMAQGTESYDILTYTPLSGWQKEEKDFARSYSTVDQAKGTWCQVALYKSVNSSGDARMDFDGEWKAIVVKSYNPEAPPDPKQETVEGWTVTYGVSTFQWQGKESYILLYTISGHGRLMSITMTMNNQDYMKDLEKFVASIGFVVPETPAVPQAAQVPAAAIQVSDAPHTFGISVSTTNFDDGWVAQPFADYVRVTKGKITVLLHYGIQVDDEMRYANDMQRLLFDRLILPRYTVSNVTKFDNGGPCYFCIDFFEADAVEKSTGSRVHLGFRVLTESGVSRCIEIISPSAADFKSTFPDHEKVAAMWGYNKFAIAASDLTGTWEESSGSYVNMYNSVTGAYAGMNTASSAATFVFNADGTYNSHHSGAMGMVGSMQFFDQKYKGKATVTHWEITMTNRWEGKTDIFWASFEAVRGGVVLHLTDSQAVGMKYHLLKAK